MQEQMEQREANSLQLMGELRTAINGFQLQSQHRGSTSTKSRTGTLYNLVSNHKMQLTQFNSETNHIQISNGDNNCTMHGTEASTTAANKDAFPLIRALSSEDARLFLSSIRGNKLLKAETRRSPP
ncbi:hypothetical protein FXO38_17875 [Capsicum annuum]|nr:hypothetical protein FXO38_17875 [Capsicum annuum]